MGKVIHKTAPDFARDSSALPLRGSLLPTRFHGNAMLLGTPGVNNLVQNSLQFYLQTIREGISINVETRIWKCVKESQRTVPDLNSNRSPKLLFGSKHFSTTLSIRYPQMPASTLKRSSTSCPDR